MKKTQFHEIQKYMHKNFVLRTILEYKKIGFYVRIVYSKWFGPSGNSQCFIRYIKTRLAIVEGVGASFEAILQKIRILDIKK